MCVSSNKIQRIVPAMMLYENIRDKLDKDKILRPIAKDSDQIWQQMKLENFDKLLKSKRLYMKAHSEYSDYDEKKIQQYSNTCYKTDDNKQRKLNKKLREYENQMYISCWYSSSNLSDVVFKQYADNGVAIGTDVRTFIDCINSSMQGSSNKDAQNYKCFAGNVQYIYHKDLTEHKIFENTQIVCPIFLKGMQFKADNEFRFCILKETDINNKHRIITGNANYSLCDKISKSLSKNIFNVNQEDIVNVLGFLYKLVEDMNTKKNVKSLFLENIDFKKLIKRIAFKDDSIYKLLDDYTLENIVNKKLSNIGLMVKRPVSNFGITRENGFIKIELEER